MTEQNNSKHDELSSQALEAQLRQMPTPQPPAELQARLLADIPPANPTPRLTYRLPLIRTAAAAAILMVVVGLFAWLTVGNGGASIAFADVLEQMEKSQTLTYTFRQKANEGGEERIQVTRVAHMAPNFSRFDIGTDMIHIIDGNEKKVLVLRPANKTGTIHELGSRSPTMDFIEQIKEFRDGSEEELKMKQIDGRKVMGFKFHKQVPVDKVNYVDTVVWADIQTNLPVRIESTIVFTSGARTEYVATEIKFDIELDESLFSFEHEGYTIKPGIVKMGYEIIK